MNVYELVEENIKGIPYKVYYGEMRKGTTNVKEGRGILVYQTGGMHIGNFKGGESNGLIRLISLSKVECYEGEMAAGKKQGQGINYYNNGTVYEGTFRNGSKTDSKQAENEKQPEDDKQLKDDKQVKEYIEKEKGK
jgi:hypothetical protein